MYRSVFVQQCVPVKKLSLALGNPLSIQLLGHCSCICVVYRCHICGTAIYNWTGTFLFFKDSCSYVKANCNFQDRFQNQGLSRTYTKFKHFSRPCKLRLSLKWAYTVMTLYIVPHTGVKVNFDSTIGFFI